MDKCRICLTEGNHLYNVYDVDENTSLKYTDMLHSVAKIKVIKNDEITNKMCHYCCDKLKELYNFKCLIERSDAVLQTNITNLRRLCYNNVNEIKIEIDYIKTEPQFIKKCQSIIGDFQNGDEPFFYKDTVIKKIKRENGNRNEPVPVLEFLKTITLNDYDDNFDPDPFGSPMDDDDDDEYLPVTKKIKNKIRKKKYDRKKEKKVNSTKNMCSNEPKILIKPKILTDLRLVPAVRKSIRDKKRKRDYLRKDICPHCGKITRSLKKHLIVHSGERKFKCEECGKGYFTASCLNSHRKTHTKERKFKCDKCVATFTNKTSLGSHSLSHIDVKKHICKVCSKSFKRKATLLRHEAAHNSANKCIKCELCKMSFFTKYGLGHHMRVHTGERPFKCEICSQPYSYKHDFNRHCFKKHGVFLKRRNVYVMNEEVLQQERALMRNLMLRVHGDVQDGEPLNPFEGEGPQAAMAFEMAMKALEERKIPLDFP